MTDTAAHRNQHSHLPEHDFVVQTLADVVKLRRELLERGYSESFVSGLTGWLIARSHGEPDNLSGVTRTKYRRALEDLGRARYRCTVRSRVAA